MPLHMLGKEFGVSAQAVRKWLSAESLPTTARASLIAERLGVRRSWLLDGEAPMRITGAHIREPGVVTYSGGEDSLSISNEEFQLLRAYRLLPRSLQETLNLLVHEITVPQR